MSTENEVEINIEKPSRATRIMRDLAARMRRKETKQHVEEHSFKEQKEARDRLKAQRRMEKLQRKKKRRETGE